MKVSTIARGWGIVSGLVLVGMFLAGCQSGPERQFSGVSGVTGAQPQPTGTGSSRATPRPETGTDIIKVGDNLVVTFADLPGPQLPDIQDKVRDDGTIRLIQNLTFKAAGKARQDLEKEIHDTYVPQYYKTMTVTVKQMQNTQFYYVDGEVRTPNRQIYISRVTVLQAIASANGFTDFARKKAVVLTRANGQVFKVNCAKAIRNPSLDLEVFPGDTIHVPRRNPIW